MVKAEQKRKENISEYIIYMYQTEDLLRTFKFDLNEISKYVISSLPIPDTGKKEVLLWYASTIESMQAQKIEESGHLAEIEKLFLELTDLHIELKENEEDYLKIANKAAPFIKSQIKISNNELSNPIQVAINAVYGFLLLKINGRDLNNEQQKMLDSFGDLLSYLSFKFKEERN